jgi:hypothetical protein
LVVSANVERKVMEEGALLSTSLALFSKAPLAEDA